VYSSADARSTVTEHVDRGRQYREYMDGGWGAATGISFNEYYRPEY
jgi:hypothetical protein